MSQYDLSPSIEYCMSKGLAWDFELSDRAVALAAKYELSNAALNEAIRLHVDAMIAAFDPTRFTWVQRVKLAFGFAGLWLGILKPKWSR